MERGHIPDFAHSFVLESRWAPGDPQQRRFIGGIKWKDDAQIRLSAYRCAGCGFVELYALPK